MVLKGVLDVHCEQGPNGTGRKLKKKSYPFLSAVKMRKSAVIC